jgi:hypothetical protein
LARNLVHVTVHRVTDNHTESLLHLFGQLRDSNYRRLQ